MLSPARLSHTPGARCGLLVRTVLRGCLGLTVIAPAALPTLVAAGPAAAEAVVMVPPGNRNAVQPAIPFASARRTAASRSSYDSKFDRVVGVLRRDTRLIRNIKSVSAKYGVAPIHTLGAIVGEHTYNYDSLDSAQSYYVKALAYAGVSLSFALKGEHVDDFVQRPQFDSCRQGRQDSNRLWSCYERVWERQFRGRR